MKALKTFLLLFLLGGCIDPYLAQEIVSNTNLLVVDGFIDATGLASVKLTRTMSIDDITDPKPVTNAVVTITSSRGETFSLNETTPGNYNLQSIDVDYVAEYSLRVKTADNKEYYSDNVKILPTPDIGRIYSRAALNNEYIEITTDSRDTNPEATGYYIFDAVETYQYHSEIYAKYKIVNGSAVELSEEEQISDCWLTTATNPVVADVNRLSEKIISGQVVSRIERYSKKLSMKYSALVRQRSITQAEYVFRDQITKTTEQTGTMFGVIPGVVTGNINATSSDEYVLGWFGGRDTKEKRFFLYVNDLPDYFKVQEFQNCRVDYSCPRNLNQNAPLVCRNIEELAPSVPIATLILNQATHELIQVVYTSIECGDCRAFGGVNKKPPFWDDDF